MIYFRTVYHPGTSATAEQIGRDKDGDLVKIVHGVSGSYWDGGTITAPGFAIEDMHGHRLAWHYHPGAAEDLASNIARKLRQGVTVEAIRAANSNQGNDAMKTLEAAASLRPTFASMWLANIREAMHRAGMPRPENNHTTATGSAIYFTDPEDGQRYRITVEPIKADEEHKF